MKTRLRAYVAATAVAGAICFVAADWTVPAGSGPTFWNAVTVLAVLAFLSEASYLRQRVGRTATDSSVAFIPFIAAVHLFASGWAVLVTALSELLVEQFVRRKPAAKVLFNTSQSAISVWLSSAAFQAAGGTASFTTFAFTPVATALAVATFFIVNSAAVSLALALAEELTFPEAWARVGGASLVYDLFSSPLGVLLAFLYVRAQVLGVVILVLPVYFIRHIYQVNLQLEEVNRNLLELMVKAIEARDPYTSGHSRRVSEWARRIGRASGLTGRQLEQLGTAALLHDVGKIHEDFAPLLRKDGRLTAEERAVMESHPSRSADLVATISSFKGFVVEAVRHHHENYDGTGYPDGLAGEQIPLAARIIMIADTIDAMTTDRPYRRALSFDEVGRELQRLSGRQFDPRLVQIVGSSPSFRRAIADRPEMPVVEDRPAVPLEAHLRAGRPEDTTPEGWVSGIALRVRRRWSGSAPRPI